MAKVFLLLGSNVGNKKLFIDTALDYIEKRVGVIILKSVIYETMAWGNTAQQAFLNMAIEINTVMGAVELLKALQNIEGEMGRVRDEKWAPRTIDLDILFYGELIINTATLVIPHPLLHQRRFTIVPLAEIAADYIHPVLLKSMRSLLDECPDPLDVKIYEDN